MGARFPVRTIFLLNFPMLGLSHSALLLPPLFAEVDPAAMPVFENVGFLSFLTNSTVVAAIVLGLILWMSRKATTNMQLVPHPAQNFFEFIVEFFYARIEAIVGPKVAPATYFSHNSAGASTGMNISWPPIASISSRMIWTTF